MSILQETYTLNDGNAIPKLGLGTWFIGDRNAAGAVRSAVGLGYRLFDTAQAYGNEAGVGEGVRTCGVPREELFVTSKIAAEAKSYESASRAVDEMLATSGLDYLDLAIIHSPQPWRDWRKDDRRFFAENVEAYRALEDAQKAGKLRSVGVSNFLVDDLQNILDNCTVIPAVNQVLCHVSSTPAALIEFCQRNGVLVEAYAPIAHGKMLKNRRLVSIAGKYGVTPSQLCIRYCIQLGCVAIPKTENPAHMAENAAVDFEISAEDMAELAAFEPIKSYGILMNRMPVFSRK